AHREDGERYLVVRRDDEVVDLADRLVRVVHHPAADHLRAAVAGRQGAYVDLDEADRLRRSLGEGRRGEQRDADRRGAGEMTDLFHKGLHSRKVGPTGADETSLKKGRRPV